MVFLPTDPECISVYFGRAGQRFADEKGDITA